jgi:hypothetical protein
LDLLVLDDPFLFLALYLFCCPCAACGHSCGKVLVVVDVVGLGVASAGTSNPVDKLVVGGMGMIFGR